MSDYDIIWDDESGEYDIRFSGPIVNDFPVDSEKPVNNLDEFSVHKTIDSKPVFFTHTHGIIFFVLVALAPIVALWRGTGDTDVLNFIIGICIGGVVLLTVDRYKNNG